MIKWNQDKYLGKLKPLVDEPERKVSKSKEVESLFTDDFKFKKYWVRKSSMV